MVYAALKDRAITLFMDGGKPVGVTRIAGREGVRIRVVKVQMKKGGMLPKVEYVEIFGLDQEGTLVCEKKLP